MVKFDTPLEAKAQGVDLDDKKFGGKNG